ncbi:glu-rich pro-rich WW domain-containing protein [Laccaria bicolor S238N-H82]|uniref:Glu-rich pro-rich WW domain-containing protein n=1 Tax=Laccaria bicolor (strain S238N-H82 / ATCC MYA-4686) TaxID=486041 RepID=B0CY91_LACBS|nr:glu-rich pro-rich WW domain-containing protein [Laccaria bicolor S238N-H82]EDR12401.1 glu-rich pro-rich WW domain-containing protein [Laccaria bicolor S238N-H82]|eukprot:XP_001876665.1 glu-rich pro-rich WW domain-containing protein [Laccaria bicolor S238N-H82]
MSSSSFAPPLPVGWTEHADPGGHFYYFNSQTQESTYVRPLPPFFTSSHASQPLRNKERPLVKTPIPGTDWLRVRTTEGNTFYSHKIRKESVWIVPEEIESDVKAFEQQEREREDMSSRNKPVGENKLESSQGHEGRKSVKRKIDHSVPLDEVEISKRAKVEEEEEESEESDASEEEDWQREAAAQLAEEAAEERKRVEEEERRAKEAEAEAKRTIAVDIPQKVNLSLDEGKALFKTLLREKDINPLLPWDICLPQFISDPRYTLLPSVAVRREAFDEFCRDRSRELRQSNLKKEKRDADPAGEYDRLLREEVKSTRASWTDFRRAWKKDRRFYGWGRDDREREKRFKEYLRELGEQKRVAARKAEANFFSLLKEHQAKIRKGSTWKETKRLLSGDRRYDAIASSSLREELFNAFMKGTALEPTRSEELVPVVSQGEAQEDHQGRKERAVKEREEQVKAELGRLKTNIERSKIVSNKVEGESIFMCATLPASSPEQRPYAINHFAGR